MRKALVAVLVAVACSAFAQTTPPDGGTPPQGRRAGGRATQGPSLLLRPQVEQELKLSTDQISKIQALLPAPGSTPQRMTAEERKQQADQVKSILTPDQYTRYQQIVLQLAGPRALERKQVATELGLSADQVSQIRQIIASYQPSAPTAPAGGTAGPTGGAPGRAPRLTRAQREEMDGKILAVLTPDQKTKWQSMIGAPFTLSRGRGR